MNIPQKYIYSFAHNKNCKMFFSGFPKIIKNGSWAHGLGSYCTVNLPTVLHRKPPGTATSFFLSFLQVSAHNCWLLGQVLPLIKTYITILIIQVNFLNKIIVLLSCEICFTTQCLKSNVHKHSCAIMISYPPIHLNFIKTVALL